MFPVEAVGVNNWAEKEAERLQRERPTSYARQVRWHRNGQGQVAGAILGAVLGHCEVGLSICTQGIAGLVQVARKRTAAIGVALADDHGDSAALCGCGVVAGLKELLGDAGLADVTCEQGSSAGVDCVGNNLCLVDVVCVRVVVDLNWCKG